MPATIVVMIAELRNAARLAMAACLSRTMPMYQSFIGKPLIAENRVNFTPSTVVASTNRSLSVGVLSGNRSDSVLPISALSG
ncbi:hypothetical protein D3C84_1064740 [compost metagenome]